MIGGAPWWALALLALIGSSGVAGAISFLGVRFTVKANRAQIDATAEKLRAEAESAAATAENMRNKTRQEIHEDVVKEAKRLRERVTELEKQVSDLQREISKAEDYFTEQERMLSEQLEALRKDLRTVEGQREILIRLAQQAQQWMADHYDPTKMPTPPKLLPFDSP